MATCKILVGEPLRQHTGGKHRLAGTGDTVGEVCDLAAREYPELLRSLFRDDGRLRNGVTIFLNGVDTRALGGLRATIREGDIVNLHVPMLV